VSVRYSKDGGVVELSLVPTGTLLFHGADLLKEADPIGVLLGTDPDPFEWVGFVVFLAVGVALTGYHDGDHAQRAITAFAPGRWDGYRDHFSPMNKWLALRKSAVKASVSNQQSTT
jgi:hypothetical protein